MKFYKKYLKIRFTIVLSLFVLFTWWGMMSVEKYCSEPLTTDIGYKFGDGIDNGIQFPVISFCQYDKIKNSYLKVCNNGSFNFIPSFINCLRNNKNFKFDLFMASLELDIGAIIENYQLWTGLNYIDLKHSKQNVWSTVFQYQFGLCHSFDLSNIKEYEFVQYNKGSRLA